MDVAVDPSAGTQLEVNERVVDRAARAVEQHPPRQAFGVVREGAGVGRRLRELADDVHFTTVTPRMPSARAYTRRARRRGVHRANGQPDG